MRREYHKTLRYIKYFAKVTFNPDMRKAGVHPSVIMAIMGHEDGGMFGRYNAIDPEDLVNAVSRLESPIKISLSAS